MLETRPTGYRRDAFVEALESYLATTLHAHLALGAWDGGSALPVFLARRYRFYRAAIAHRDCLFMATQNARDTTTADIAKHVALVGATFDGVVVFATDRLTANLRARLIAQGVAFAIPGNQLYIPQLAMDLRDHFRAPHKTRGDRLSPAAQVVLFHHVLRRQDEWVTPSMLAEPLHYSAMSIGRAFDELAAVNLATVEWRGREKTIRYNTDRRALIEISRTRFQSPVRTRYAVRIKQTRPPLMLAGESALAELTNLTPPPVQTFAVAATGWRAACEEWDLVLVRDGYDADAMIETWRYDPLSLATGDIVDRLSLHAQFWDHPDERVAQAARELLTTLP